VYQNNTGAGSFGTPMSATSTSCSTQTNNLFADPTIKQAIIAAAAVSGGTVTCAVGPLSGSNGTFWQIAVPLKTNSGQAWCVSSTGIAKQISATNPLNAGAGCL
jgi:hypothetical protein